MAVGFGGGILSEVLRQMQLRGINATPVLENNVIRIEFTESQFKEATTRDMDPRVRDAINIRFTEGKMIIEVRLF